MEIQCRAAAGNWTRESEGTWRTVTTTVSIVQMTAVTCRQRSGVSAFAERHDRQPTMAGKEACEGGRDQQERGGIAKRSLPVQDRRPTAACDRGTLPNNYDVGAPRVSSNRAWQYDIPCESRHKSMVTRGSGTAMHSEAANRRAGLPARNFRPGQE